MKDKNTHSFLDYFTSSLVGIPQSFIQVIATQPFNNARLFQQSHRYPINLLKTFQELGIKKSFEGFGLSMTKIGAQNMVLNPVLLLADRSFTKEFCEENPLTAAFAKSFSSTATKLALTPIDVMLFKKIIENISPKQTLKNILSQPGIVPKFRAGYVGLLPDALNQLVGNFSIFLAKDHIHHAEKLIGIERKDDKLSAFDMTFAGFLSAALKIVVTQPFSTISSVMKDSRNNANTIGDAIQVLKERAELANSSLFKTFFRGIVPRTLTSTVASTLTIAMLDFMKEETKQPQQDELRTTHTEEDKLEATSLDSLPTPSLSPENPNSFGLVISSSTKDEPSSSNDSKKPPQSGR
jgi:hypothetical protein